MSQIQQIRDLTRESEKVLRRKSFGMREDPNPMFNLQFDLFRFVCDFLQIMCSYIVELVLWLVQP